MAFASDNTWVLGGSGGADDGFIFGTATAAAWDGPSTTGSSGEGGDIAWGTPSILIVTSGVRSTDNGQSFISDPDAGGVTVAFGLNTFIVGGFSFGAFTGLAASPGNGTWTFPTTPFVTAGFGAGVFGSHFNEFTETFFIGGTKDDSSGGISTSADAITWSAYKPNSFTDDGTFAASINDFASSETATIAVGSKGVAGIYNAHAQRSTNNGDSWVDLTLDGFTGPDSFIEAAAFGDNTFLIAGRGTPGIAHLERSIDDGVTWNAVDISDILPNSGQVNDVKWSPDLEQFILVAFDGDLGPTTAISPTGDVGTWTVQSLAYPTAFDAMFAIAVGSSSTPPTPAESERETLVRDPWDIDEWGRFYPGAGFHKIT